MDKIIKFCLVAMLSVGASNVSLAAMINDGGIYDGTNVGSVDNFVQEGPQQGNPTAELAWVNGILGPGLTYTSKDSPAGGITFYSTDMADVFAFLFNPAPGDDVFIIKNATRIALYENVDDLNWGVFDINDLSENINLPNDSFTISHVTQFNDPNTPPPPPPTGVPEPSLIALFGLGLFGMGISHMFRRRKAS